MKKTSDTLLLIFIKNLELGKVKTRLAKTIGDEKALEVYKDLLKHTHKITFPLQCDKAIFYSNFIEKEDIWENNIYQKFQQAGESLGERMATAFEKAFEMNYKQVGIIGSDCAELQTQILEKGLNSLQNKDFSIGPAKDGGYYFLGMSKFQKIVFENKTWSQENVFQDTIQDFKNLNASFEILETLSDVDYEADLKTLYG